MKIGGFQKFSMIDYPDKFSAIVFTLGCNLSCPFCHNPELNSLNFLENALIKEDVVLDFLKTRVGKLDGVVLSGGEPTLQTNLINFSRKIKDLGFLIKLDTNGTNSFVIKELLEYELVDYIAMDIKTSPQKYNFFVNNVNTFKEIQKSIELIISSNIDYEFRTTVVKELLLIEDFKEIGKLINGAQKYYLQKFQSIKLLDETYKNAKTFSEEEFLIAKNILKPYIKEIIIR